MHPCLGRIQIIQHIQHRQCHIMKKEHWKMRMEYNITLRETETSALQVSPNQKDSNCGIVGGVEKGELL